MSQIPVPPEMPNLEPKGEYYEVISPDTDKPKGSPSAATTTTTSTAEPTGSALKGCLWLFGGMFACAFLFILVLVGALLAVGKEVPDFVGTLANFFQIPLNFVDWDERAQLPVRNGVYLPPVERIQALSEIVTTRFSFSQMVTGQSDMPAVLAGLYGDGLVMVAVGHIEAGIDVSQISAENVQFDETTNTLTMLLPAPKIRACFLNESQSYVVSRQTGIFAQPVPQLEVSTRQYALRQFRQQAMEDGILEESANQLLGVMQEFLQTVVGEGVQIEVRMSPIDPNAPLPDGCP